MIKVYQEIIAQGSGDCFSACLASILELPISSVPKFARDHGARMNIVAREWLHEHFNLSLVSIRLEDRDHVYQGKDLRLVGGVCGTPCILTYPSPNIPGSFHAVVGQIDEHGLNFQIIHDPNPKGAEIRGYPVVAEFLVPMVYRPQPPTAAVMRKAA